MKTLGPSLALGLAVATALAGCASATGSPVDAAPSTRACVILPDAASAPRWERDDRPELTRAFEAAGFSAEVRNAEGATGSYDQIGSELLADGCGVLLLVDFDGAAEGVAARARAAGIPVIAYDRPVRGADYYVAFDYPTVGALQGETIVAELEAAGKDPAASAVFFVSGDTTDSSTALVRAAAASKMSTAGITVTAAFDGTGNPHTTAHRFAAELDAKGGRIDAVWVNDTDAAGVVSVLESRGITVPVTGQDATVQGLRNVLRGVQSSTIYKDYREEARRAATVAIGLLAGNDLDPETDGFLGDGTPYLKVPVERIGRDKVARLVDDGVVRASELCTSEVAEACAELGIA